MFHKCFINFSKKQTTVYFDSEKGSSILAYFNEQPWEFDYMETFSGQMKTSATNQTPHPAQQYKTTPRKADQNNLASKPSKHYSKIILSLKKELCHPKGIFCKWGNGIRRGVQQQPMK